MDNKLVPQNPEEDNLPALSADKEQEAFVEAIISFVTGIAAKLFPVLGFLTLWRQKRQNKKEEELLKSLRKQLSAQTQSIASISNMLKNPKGFVLFNKIMYLARTNELEDESFDEFSNLLAQILIHISTKDFESLFGEVSYAISRIEKLSPQALFLLSDSDNWPKVSVGGTTTSDVTLSGKWKSIVSNAYVREKGIENKTIAGRVAYSFGELESNGLAIISKEKRIILTDAGREVYDFLLQS